MSTASSVSSVSLPNNPLRSQRSNSPYQNNNSNSPTELLFDALLQWTPNTETPVADSAVLLPNDPPSAEKKEDVSASESKDRDQEEVSSVDQDPSPIVEVQDPSLELQYVSFCGQVQQPPTQPTVPEGEGTKGSPVVEEATTERTAATDLTVASSVIRTKTDPQATPNSTLAIKKPTSDLPSNQVATSTLTAKNQSQPIADRSLVKKKEVKTSESPQVATNDSNAKTKSTESDKRVATNVQGSVEGQGQELLRTSHTESKEENPSKNRRELQLEKNRQGDGHDRRDSSGFELNTRPSDSKDPIPQGRESNLNGESNATSPSASPVQNDPAALAPPSATGTVSAAVPSALSQNLVSDLAGRSSNQNGTAISGLSPTDTTAANNTASSATQSGSRSSGTLSPRQEVRLVQRVLRGFEQLANGDGQVKLRLHPPQLGSLQMTLKMDGTQMSAKLEVENSLARDALMENLPKLREKLAEQGIQVDQFEVQLAPPSESNAGQNMSGGPRGDWLGQSDSRNENSNGRRSPGNWRAQIDGPSGSGAIADTVPMSHSMRRVESKGLDLTA